jgi:glycosyltransferase involved in cell wall biosynthesis
MKTRDQIRVLIVAENASAKFGGEAILPLHYFRFLRQRGIETWLLVNARNKAELQTILPADDLQRCRFVPDTWFHRLLEKLAKPFPAAIKHVTFRFVSRLLSQILSRRLARRLVIEHQIDIVHQPTPVSPKEISLMYHLGAPVVMGPMNGGMSYPPGFEKSQHGLVAWMFAIGRYAAHGLNRLLPGKLLAETILVANQRTELALPHGIRGRILTVVENGVNLSLWTPKQSASDQADGSPIRFVFSGRLVGWKGVNFLIAAFARVAKEVPATLEIMGNGNMLHPLEQQTIAAGLAGRVKFHLWKTQSECAEILIAADVFVIPSLYECGGAVILEAMACGLPVIATNWGGPADYLDDACGILIVPESPEIFIDRLAQAMLRLAKDPGLRASMGAAGRAKAIEQFDWQRKIDHMLDIYAQTIPATDAA